MGARMKGVRWEVVASRGSVSAQCHTHPFKPQHRRGLAAARQHRPPLAPAFVPAETESDLTESNLP